MLVQLQQFQTDRERLGLVVDEYGELQGLVTIEDIVEEIIGDFTTQAPAGGETWARDPDGSVVVDGMAALRTLNRKLGTHFPLDGPKTLNGLIVEQLGEIPDAGTQVAACRPAYRNPANPGPGGQSGAAAATRGARAGGPGFTKPGRTGIISCLTFMRLE